MKQPSPELLQALTTAAELRAVGLAWEVIAGRVGRKPATCARWPSMYPELWRRQLREAARRAEEESANEARATLRKMLRGDDEKKKLDAASQLLKTKSPKKRAKSAIRPEDRALAAFISEVRSVSDEELERIARRYLAKDSGLDGAPDPPRAA